MSKTIAGKVLASIWETFKELFPSFIDKTYKKIEPELRQEISWITQIVSKINDIVQSPAADVAVALINIKGNPDEAFLSWARQTLPKWIAKYGYDLTNSEKALISAELTKERTDIELSQALITSQVVYKKENS